MINFYRYNKETIYISLHLNAIFNYKLKSFKINYLDDGLFKEIIQLLEHNRPNFSIFDFKHISSIYSRTLEGLNVLVLKHNLSFVCIHCNDLVKKQLLVDCAPHCKIIGDLAIVSQAGDDYIINVLNNDNRLLSDLGGFKKSCIAEFLKSKCINKKYYLDSSNVFSNKYVDIKTLFGNSHIYPLAIWLLCDLINDNFKIEEYDEFISSSSNGLAIATLISVLFEKNFSYILKLGPHLTIMDKLNIKGLEKGKRYLYLYDFYCLGTEYKMTKLLAGLNDSRVIGGVGIAKHIDRSEINLSEKQVFSLFKINDDFNFDYSLSIY